MRLSKDGAVRASGSITVFDVDVQDQHIAPMRGVVERPVDDVERIIDYGVDFALQMGRRLRGIHCPMAALFISMGFAAWWNATPCAITWPSMPVLTR